MIKQASRLTTDPVVEFTKIPAYGSRDKLEGVVHDIDAEHVRIAVYIRVHGGWWTKPYWTAPLTPIAADGSFSVDITTGGHDAQALEIIAFLVPADYYPPSLRGDFDLPEELFTTALSRFAITRTA
jgi:hypothetical protein